MCPNEGCNYVAPQKCILVSHMDTCGEAKQNKKHKYPECGKGYRSKKYLRLHMAADHPTGGKMLSNIHAPTQVVKKYIKVQMHSGHIKILGTIL